MSATPVPQPDKSNIQGMIMRGFTHPYSCHMVFKFGDKPGAKSFIKAIFPYVQPATDWGDAKPQMMLNIGLTFNGIKVACDFSANDLVIFPPTFKAGPASGGSQQSLNDLGTSAPKLWAFGNAAKPVDCVVHIYALSASALAKLVTIVSEAATAGGLTEYLPVENGTKRLEEYATIPRNSIHFGYQDGIDQPALGWDDPNDPADLRNFLIGYAGASSDPGPAQPPGKVVDFAKNGCYNAFRILYQDEEVFDNFLEANANTIATKLGKTTGAAKEWLAAKLNGRWRNGSPLELSPNEPEEKTWDATDFGYDKDTDGMRCPFASHTRVANPRNEELSDPGAPPRLIRRGMAYGTPPLLNNYKGDRGLIGLFLCGSLANQFELLYSWINTTNFSDLFPSQQGQDALLANRLTQGADTSYTIPTDKGPVEIAQLPQFVVARGTAYCLLPSLSALKSIFE